MVMKLIIQILQLLSPKLVSSMAYHFMSKPKIRKLRDSEETVLDKSTKEKIAYKNFQIQKYQWGNQNHKTALLIHGWEGQAGNFASVVDILVQRSYHVIAFDAPAHGKSTIAKTTMFEFAEFLESQFFTLNPRLIISHSFGSVNTATIFRNNPAFKTDLWIMVTTPHRFLTRVNEISNHFGLNNKVKTELINRIQEDSNENINQLNMGVYCKELSNVGKAIIVHSRADKVLPIKGAREVAKVFSESKLIELDHLGHYSILWSEELNKIISQHI